jgi:hypothetical protein
MLPSQNEHLKPPFLPVPLQEEQVSSEVPDPPQAPHSAARLVAGPNAWKPQSKQTSNQRQISRGRIIPQG